MSKSFFGDFMYPNTLPWAAAPVAGLAHAQQNVRQVVSAVKPGGHVIIVAFGPEGPSKRSSLDVKRYDADSFHAEFGRASALWNGRKACTKRRSEPRSNLPICYCIVN